MTAVATEGDLGKLLDLAERLRRRPFLSPDTAAGAVESVVGEIAARRAEGGDVLIAKVYADSIPDLHAAALLEASKLWGPEASLTVEETGTVYTSSRGKGRFFADVRVCCLNFAEISA